MVNTTKSIENAVLELGALKKLISIAMSKEECVRLAVDGIDEVVYNLSLISKGVTYISDEFQFRASRK